MRAGLVILGLFILTTSALRADAELDAFQGAWGCTALNFEGQELPSVAATANTLTVTGDKYVVVETDRGEVESGTLKLDGTKSPKTIDFLIEKASTGAGKTQLGVYKLEGDVLTYTVTEPGKTERPASVGPHQGYLHASFKKKAATGANTSTTATAPAAVGAASPAPVASPAASASPAPAPAGSVDSPAAPASAAASAGASAPPSAVPASPAAPASAPAAPTQASPSSSPAPSPK